MDPKNMGIAVGISLQSCVQAEITRIWIFDAAMLDFPLPVVSGSSAGTSIGMADIEMGG